VKEFSGASMDKPAQSSAQVRWWDLPAAFLLLLILTTAFTRLVATEWTTGLGVTRTITYLGLIAGLALGQSRFSPRLAFLFALLYGLFTVPWRLGLLMGEGVLWDERLQSMAGRLATIFSQLFARQAVSDSFLFLVLMGILYWAISAYAGYSLTRYASPWRVVLPPGIAMVLIHSYDSYLSARVWYLVIYLFFSLMLVARLVYLHNNNRWKLSNTYVPPYLGVDFIRLAVAAVLILLVLTWTTPAAADAIPAAQTIWQRIKEPWNDARNTLDNAFSSLRSTMGIVSDYYGPNLSLGRGNRLTDTQVFNVVVPAERPEGVRYYWKARSYDQYHTGWSSSILTTELVDPDDFDLKFADSKDNAPGTYSFSFAIGTPLSTLLTPHQVTWVSRPAKLEVDYNDNGEADLATVRASPALRSGEIYHVRSSLNNPTVESLRKAGSDYPEWVTDRYLQLPDTITQRTRNLAESLAAGKETPYDIVAAVTDYLRDNIEYTETVPPLPLDQDLVDWFLFDIEQGFCNYYASAEVILLRAVGIPARMAVGYAEGEPLETNNQYVVRQRDSHSWPEVYFPEIGWVEFEPTVSQPSIIRPVGNPSPEAEDQSASVPPIVPTPSILESARLRELEDEEAASRSAKNSMYLVSGILIVLLAAMIGLLIPFARKKRWHEKIPAIPIMLETGMRKIGLQPPAFLKEWAFMARLSPLARAYHEINRALSRLGSRPNPNFTPAERAASLGQLVPQAAPPADRLLDEYQLTVYGQNYSPDLVVAQQAGKEIRSLSLRAWLQQLINERKKPK
jgi:transglutaminase-like putative cysteine protease